ncbi:UTRA domain-containing protein [Saccharomonospora sp. NPDC046836]|uniref:UTRA domain-containing protein n=1 Tax=Saccharomonospora sp. NPDC046836 TaxID=3156921 RepID=UPI003403EF8E
MWSRRLRGKSREDGGSWATPGGPALLPGTSRRAEPGVTRGRPRRGPRGGAGRSASFRRARSRRLNSSPSGWDWSPVSRWSPAAASCLAELGVPPRRCVDRVSARVPTQEEHRLLRLPTGLPVLRTLRVAFSADGRPVEATVMVKAGHLYELEYGFGVE